MAPASCPASSGGTPALDSSSTWLSATGLSCSPSWLPVSGMSESSRPVSLITPPQRCCAAETSARCRWFHECGQPDLRRLSGSRRPADRRPRVRSPCPHRSRPAPARASLPPVRSCRPRPGSALPRSGPLCRSTPPDPTSRSTSRRSFPDRSITRPPGPNTTRCRPACRRSATVAATVASVSSYDASIALSGRYDGSRCRRSAAVRIVSSSVMRPASTPAATTGTALHRMPRSPSTVRVTGCVATTSRPRFASSGSSSITECTSVVAPPMSTTATSPCNPASTSTPRSTTSGVAARTIRAKAGSRDRFLPPITCARNISRIAARALSGANTPISGTTLSASTCGTPAAARVSRISGWASTLPATTTGRRHLYLARVVAASEQHRRVAPVRAAQQQYDVGALACEAPSRWLP